MIIYTSALFLFFFFNDTPTTEIYTLSLHDALPILRKAHSRGSRAILGTLVKPRAAHLAVQAPRWQLALVLSRSEEHTSELQSHSDLVCRLLLEKKKKKKEQNQRQNKKIRRTQSGDK